MTTQPANVSVTWPISPAIDRVRLLLFRPFDLGKWFVIGFCAWLATLGERGGFNFNYSRGSQHRLTTENLHEWFERVRDFVMNNLSWLLPLTIVLGVFLITLCILMIWLRSRGSFMFLHCVALNKAEIDVPWNKYAAAGNSLFAFRLVLGLISMVPMLSFLAIMIVTFIRLMNQGRTIPLILLTLLPLGLMFFAVGIFFFVIRKLTTDFVVPIMFLRGSKCLGAWSEFLSLLSLNIGRFIVYLLFQIVLGMLVIMIVLAAFVVTCCIACCLVIIPYIGTVLLLPLLAFMRSYSLYYLAQYGPHYDVFPPAPPAPTPPIPPA
ncbi:MAG: hypothetical protein ABSD58_03085 [Verrucomicrobiia bacterium]|jgi:hypothetical protein